MSIFRDLFYIHYGIFFIVLVLVSQNYADKGALQLTEQNINSILASNELVFINFYAEWCRFSSSLAPIFDEAADLITEAFPNPGSVVMGKVDCEKEIGIATRFHITKYPSLKVIRNGQPTKREYRGQRTAQAFKTFIEKQLENPIKEFKDLKELENLDITKRVIVGYFDRKDVLEYDYFRRVATDLKDDCQFYVGFGQASKTMHPPEQPIIVFKPDTVSSNEKDETFLGNLSSYNELSIWAQKKCVPLVREITFENAEELTEEGLPFLILFHKPDDIESVKIFKNIVSTKLIDQKQNINFLTADGLKFAHPLHHLGKSEKDLPLVAIDSFRHMYPFCNFEDIKIEGKLRAFLHDLYSGKLHREFHNGPDINNEVSDVDKQIKQTPTTPPESTFKKLAPSKNRYTLLKDEL